MHARTYILCTYTTHGGTRAYKNAKEGKGEVVRHLCKNGDFGILGEEGIRAPGEMRMHKLSDNAFNSAPMWLQQRMYSLFVLKL